MQKLELDTEGIIQMSQHIFSRKYEFWAKG